MVDSSAAHGSGADTNKMINVIRAAGAVKSRLKAMRKAQSKTTGKVTPSPSISGGDYNMLDTNYDPESGMGSYSPLGLTEQNESGSSDRDGDSQDTTTISPDILASSKDPFKGTGSLSTSETRPPSPHGAAYRPALIHPILPGSTLGWNMRMLLQKLSVTLPGLSTPVVMQVAGSTVKVVLEGALLRKS